MSDGIGRGKEIRIEMRAGETHGVHSGIFVLVGRSSRAASSTAAWASDVARARRRADSQSHSPQNIMSPLYGRRRIHDCRSGLRMEGGTESEGISSVPIGSGEVAGPESFAVAFARRAEACDLHGLEMSQSISFWPVAVASKSAGSGWKPNSGLENGRIEEREKSMITEPRPRKFNVTDHDESVTNVVNDHRDWSKPHGD